MLVADHEVRLNPDDWQYDAFEDLPGYASWHDGTQIISQVGDWITAKILGPRIVTALTAASVEGPLTVQTTVPDGAAGHVCRAERVVLLGLQVAPARMTVRRVPVPILVEVTPALPLIDPRSGDDDVAREGHAQTGVPVRDLHQSAFGR
jgi:hypothetical protein